MYSISQPYFQEYLSTHFEETGKKNTKMLTVLFSVGLWEDFKFFFFTFLYFRKFNNILVLKLKWRWGGRITYLKC